MLPAECHSPWAACCAMLMFLLDVPPPAKWQNDLFIGMVVLVRELPVLVMLVNMLKMKPVRVVVTIDP